MVERGDQPHVRREQQAVAEDVARHVADPDDGDRLRLRVDAHLAEVALHRLPRAAGGDAHPLVVVADRAAGGERVAQPEPVLGGHAVGVIGERRRALVGGDHEIGVVAVVAPHVRRRHDPRGGPVVREVEQRPQVVLVAGDAFRHPRIAIRGRRRALEDEAALRAHRHDDRVLDHLRLHQTEDLGAEVLGPVGPAQPAAGNRSSAQVDALETRRVDPDLELRPRGGHARHLGRIELERQEGPARAVGAPSPKVRARSGVDQRDELAQHAILVEVGDLLQRELDGAHLARLRLRVRPRGIEAQPEQPHELGRDRRMRRERGLDERLRQRKAELAQVASVGAQHDDLVGRQPRRQHQPVEVVALELAAHHAGKGVLEVLPHVVDVDVGALDLQPVIVQPHALGAFRGDAVGPLLDHRQPHALEHGQRLGKPHRPAPTCKLEAQLPRTGLDGTVQVHRDLAGRERPLDQREVGGRRAGGEVLAVGRGKGVRVAPREGHRARLVQGAVERLGEVVLPAPRGLGEPLLERVAVHDRHLSGLRAHGDEHAHERRFG